MAAGDGHLSRTPIARRLKRSTRGSVAGRTSPRNHLAEQVGQVSCCPLFDLAPGGVYLAKPVTRPAGEPLPHRFTLTARTKVREAVCFLLHFPWPRGRWELPTTLSHGARTFLPPGFLLADMSTDEIPTDGRPVHSTPPLASSAYCLVYTDCPQKAPGLVSRRRNSASMAANTRDFRKHQSGPTRYSCEVLPHGLDYPR